MNALNFGFGFLPVVAEFYLAAHSLLRLAQGCLVFFEAAKGCKMVFMIEFGQGAIKGGEAACSHVDAKRIALSNGVFDLALSLNADKPLAARMADGDVFHHSQHFTTVAITHPAELG